MAAALLWANLCCLPFHPRCHSALRPQKFYLRSIQVVKAMSYITHPQLFARTLCVCVDPDRTALLGSSPSSSTVLHMANPLPLGHSRATGGQWGYCFRWHGLTYTQQWDPPLLPASLSRFRSFSFRTVWVNTFTHNSLLLWMGGTPLKLVCDFHSTKDDAQLSSVVLLL